MSTLRRIVTASGLIALAGALLATGIVIGARHHGTDNQASARNTSRDFMFQVIGLKTRNQGGQIINLFFHYRYANGIAESDIPNYLSLRKVAVNYLDSVDVSKNPYWETLNQHICTQLKNSFPIDAISCELQAEGDDTPGLTYEPGYHASIETLGHIEPLAVPGPPTDH